MGSDPVESLLPWRHPFRMVDRVMECVPHEKIVTSKLVSAGDAGALVPAVGEAMLPTVMVLEGMGQSASLLHQLSYGRLAGQELPMLGFLKASTFSSAHVGDAIEFTVSAVKMTRTMGLFEAIARVGEKAIAEAELALGVSRTGDDDGSPDRGGGAV